jgi:hypothetical protein
MATLTEDHGKKIGATVRHGGLRNRVLTAGAPCSSTAERASPGADVDERCGV